MPVQRHGLTLIMDLMTVLEVLHGGGLVTVLIKDGLAERPVLRLVHFKLPERDTP